MVKIKKITLYLKEDIILNYISYLINNVLDSE